MIFDDVSWLLMIPPCFFSKITEWTPSLWGFNHRDLCTSRCVYPGRLRWNPKNWRFLPVSSVRDLWHFPKWSSPQAPEKITSLKTPQKRSRTEEHGIDVMFSVSISMHFLSFQPLVIWFWRYSQEFAGWNISINFGFQGISTQLK